MPASRKPGRSRAITEAAEELRILFGTNFRAARMKAGMSQKDVQTETGIRQHYVSELENGLQNPTLETMTMLAHAVGVELRALLKPPPKRRVKRS